MHGLNPSLVLSLGLYDGEYNQLGVLNDYPLPRRFLFTESDLES